jgi:multiple sugar transport system substrate-binding protein
MATAKMATIAFRHVDKIFPDGTQTIFNLTLDVRDGEFMVIVGPSGCGKSTVLRMLAGLENVSRGEILINGRVINDWPPQRRNMAMVFQDYALYPHMTVRDNLEFPLRLQKLSRDEIGRRIAETAHLLDLAAVLERKPRQLSGGQRQRVAMGRAVVRRPSVFLMDEPLSNVDAKLRVQIRTEIAALQARLETTTIYVTHDQVEAMTLGQRVVLLRGGVVQQIAPPQELYDHPTNIFVATFLGNPGMNVVPVELDRDGAGHAVIELFDEGPIPLERCCGWNPESNRAAMAWIGFRPEALSLFDGNPDRLTLTVDVTSVEALGHEYLVYARLPGRSPRGSGGVRALTGEEAAEYGTTPGTIVARLPAGVDLGAGRALRLAVDVRRLHVFGADGGAMSHRTVSPAGGSDAGNPGVGSGMRRWREGEALEGDAGGRRPAMNASLIPKWLRNSILRPRFILLASLLALLLACDQPDPRVALDFWAFGREGEVVRTLVDQFERDNPKIRVRVQRIPWSAAHEKLLTAFAGNAMPDVFQLGNTWIPEFVAVNALAELEPMLTLSDRFDESDVFPGIMKTNEIGGKTYGLPWYVDTRLIFYRRDILRAAGIEAMPSTWTEWLDALEALARSKTAGAAYPIHLPLDDWTPVTVFALQQNADLLKDNNSYGNFQSARFRDAFDFYLSIFRRGLAPVEGGAQVSNLYQEFANGYFAMFISGPWNIGELKQRLPEHLSDAWDTAPMPAPDPVSPSGRRGPGVSLAGGASLVIHRGSAHPAEAWKLIEFLTASTQQIEFYRLTGNLPSRRSAWNDADLAEMPAMAAFWQQLQHLEPTPQIPEWERIAHLISRTCERVIRGKRDPEQALAALDEAVDHLLEKRRWLLRHNIPLQ